jgi:hypothetical protein
MLPVSGVRSSVQDSVHWLWDNIMLGVMRSSLVIALLLSLFITGHVHADREWVPDAHTDVVARANARHAGERHDPQEDNPRLNPLFAAAEARAIRGLSNAPPTDPGFITLFWRVKKSILFRQYGIRWQSPADLNPKKSYE